MVSSAIWKKTCTSEFFKDDRNCTSPKNECNLKSLKNSLVHVFFQIARENILLLINNIHEKIIKNHMFRRHLRTPFEHCFPCLLAFFLSLYPPCI